MKQFRLNRLFDAASGRCFDVALDHGFFGESSFLHGIENIAAAIQTLCEGAPDAIQLSVGQAPLLQQIRGKTRPALVLRTDIANVYGRQLPHFLFSRLLENAVEQALRLDAVCVVVNLFQIPDQPEVSDQCVQNILKLQAQCEHFAMPLMIEPLVFRSNSRDGGYMVDGDVEKIVPLVRQAAELGADIIKADPTDDPQQYGRVIETAGRVPVLVRGGGKAPDAEILSRTHALLQQGAAGIVYGRNIIQHQNPAAMTRSLMSIVHQNASPDQAVRALEM